MNYLKITAKGWADYNGQLGIITFKDGVSTEPVPQHIADRVSGAVAMVECDKDGKEIRVAGVATRLVKHAADRAPKLEPLGRMTEEEKTAERLADQKAREKAPVENFYTKEELEAVAEKDGIKGLREIGDLWKVKSRSIPALIEHILEAQKEFLENRQKRMESRRVGAAHEAIVKEEAEAAEKAAADAAEAEAAAKAAEKEAVDAAAEAEAAEKAAAAEAEENEAKAAKEASNDAGQGELFEQNEA